ncbi:DNA recombinase [Microbacterium phage Pikmin]|uniref:DNA recombinase n=3 Tax=Pikminvirus pikmin TaxID=2560596 RepID=A0A2P1CKG2_9CAUD|nr:DNA recombinase [Microbacterium phage Pikmin]AVJ51021.1 DNA recombinase [Microbacterium phage Pajaza]AVJ51168.1 DNA recombinase [Microbacterium phage Pikmin]AVJ51726.1 DNA recombinase [Microbacterium phage Casey]
MDTESITRLIRKVWRHSGVKGSAWVPHIAHIGIKDKERFREGAAISVAKPSLPELRPDVDWYWTPAVSSTDSRKKDAYPAQRVLWVDCDDGYDDEVLTKLRPTYIWETSPGHKQAIWLMSEPILPEEFDKDGLMGMLTQAVGADKSGVDIGQLLRVPGTWHHKREPFQGRILRKTNMVYSRGEVLTRVARALGFPASVSSELGADDPYGDRSKQMWKFERTAAELGIPEDLTFKMLKACAWNKWKDNPESLRADIASAYSAQPSPVAEPPAPVSAEETLDEDEELLPWDMQFAEEYARVIRNPMKWVVPGMVPEGACGFLVAAPKVGKSRIALEMMLGLATATKPLGVDVRKPVPVGFFSLEDGQYLYSKRLSDFIKGDRRRIKYHWEGYIDKDLTWNPGKPMPLLTSFNEMDLTDEATLERLRLTVIRYGLKMIVIDTFSMAIGGANVNDQSEMYKILTYLKKRIAQPLGCAVMFIHHTRKRVFEKGETVQEKILGATALHGWADFTLSLASPEEDFPDFLRLGVQTKMGTDQHYLNKDLKIIKKPVEEESND